MRRITLHVAIFCAAALIGGACDDDNFPPPGDGGASEGVIADRGPTTDGQVGDLAQTDGGPPPSDAARADALPVDAALDGPAADAPVVLDAELYEAGWYPTEGGPVKVDDGGVLIQEDGGTVFICRIVTCSGRPQACGDCVDNDGDGLIDWRDPECLGPCDNTEGPGLESGVGGTVADVCGVDCYFDYGNGAGNDDCHWDHRCDTLSPEVGCEYDADFVSKKGDTDCPDEQSQQCTDFCLPYTPNGCDCFGCCTFPELAGAGADGSDVYVWIGNMDASNNSTCTLADVTDPVKCPPCTPVGNCLNTCGRCEICVGKPTVPEDCFRTVPPDAGVPMTEAGVPIDADIPRTEAGVPIDAGVPMTEAGVPIDVGVPADGGLPPTDGGVIINPWQCDPGVQPCGLPGQLPCAEQHYCISGCCKKVIL